MKHPGHTRLANLGWTPALDFHIDELGQPGWLLGRITRVDKGRGLLGTCDGDRPAVWPREIMLVDDQPVPCPATGDWCAASEHDDVVRVETILPRATSITRAVATGRRAAQVLAANVDIAFIVTGLDNDFSVRRIERYLAVARTGGVQPVVVLNKADLDEKATTRGDEVQRVAPGVLVRVVSALNPDDVSALAEAINPGQTAVFLGSSGAGKSTLINALLGDSRQATAPVRERDDRGKHTTSRSELFLLPSGGVVIDTPGLRQVGVLVDEAGLEQTFPEITALAGECRFGDCRHESEPGCAVQQAAAEGRLDPERLASFVKLRKEAENALLRQDAYAHRDHERKTVGKYSKWLREANRLKGKG